MRKQFLTVLLPLIVLVLITAAAQTQGTSAGAPKHAALQNVNVVRVDEGVNVEITAHGSMQPRLSQLDHPARGADAHLQFVEELGGKLIGGQKGIRDRLSTK